MIPLAQYFAASAGDDFTPMGTAPARKAQRPAAPAHKPVSALRESDGVTVLPKAPAVLARSARPATQRPLDTVSPRVLTEPRVALKVLEAERAAWAAERAAQAAALRDATAFARQEGIEIGRRLGREATEADADARVEGLRAELSENHALALGQTRVDWTEAQADRLADLVILQVAILEETIRTSLTSVLRPLALDARRRQTLEELVGAVKTIALDGAAYKISASGPQDLLAALEAKLGDHAQLLSFEADETQADIRIDADNTVIETRLSSWQLALEEALS